VNPEPIASEPALLDWLARADHEPGRGWSPEPPLAELRCHPDLVARLAEIARSVGDPARSFVAGCPVIHHPGGRPIAAAAGTAWLAVRSARPAGALALAEPRTAALAPDWVELDPWGAGAAFARAPDLLRAHMARAYELAERQETAR
jgi:hypothetical protein